MPARHACASRPRVVSHRSNHPCSDARTLAGVTGRTEATAPGWHASLAVAMGVMNVATYGFTILAARLLGPPRLRRLRRTDGRAARDHGRLARAPGDRCAPHRGHARTTCTRSSGSSCASGVQAALGLGVLCLVLVAGHQRGGAPRQPRHRRARSRSPRLPLTLMGAQAGILQGERRWAAARDDLRRRRRAPARHRHGPDPVAAHRVRRAARRGRRRLRPGAGRLVSHCGIPRDPGEPSSRAPRRGALVRRRSTTPTPCSRSSRSPTSTSWSPATSSTSTRRVCTPAG